METKRRTIMIFTSLIDKVTVEIIGDNEESIIETVYPLCP